MTHRDKSRSCHAATWLGGALALLLSGAPLPAMALESDRQQPLEVYADDTDGSLGDGTTVLSGRVEIRQGTLHIQASRAEVDKIDGKVQTIRLLGEPATLEQEIEAQGLVQAEAKTITYQVGAGIVELAGAADVTHPQYRISGEQLTYDLDRQHFEGTGARGDPADADGRIRIRLEPEVAPGLAPRAGSGAESASAEAETDTPELNPEPADNTAPAEDPIPETSP